MSFIKLKIESQKYQLIGITLIISLIFVSSCYFILLPQIVNPSILGKFFSSFQDEKILVYGVSNEDLSINRTDFIFSGKSKSLSFLQSFPSILEEASYTSFNAFEPLSQSLFAYDFIQTYDENMTVLLGIDSEFFENLLNISIEGGITGDAILLKLNTDDTANLGETNITINESVVKEINVTNILDKDTFIQKLPYFARFLIEGYRVHYFTDVYRFILINEQRYVELYNSFIETDSSYYTLLGLLSLTKNGYYKIVWSRNSYEKVESFQIEINRHISYLDEFASINIDSSPIIQDIENNSSLVDIAYSYIRGIQLVFWSLSMIILIQAINKKQLVARDKELRFILSGRGWMKRSFDIIVETSIITIAGVCIGYPVLCLLTLVQNQISSAFIFIPINFVEFIIIFSTIYLVTLLVFFTHELFLRKILMGKFDSKSGNLLLKALPRTIRLLSLIALILVLWLMNKEYNLLFIYVLISGALFIAFLALLIIQIILKIILSCYDNYKIRTNNSSSPNIILLKLWKKFYNPKMLKYSFLFAMMSSVIIYSFTTADSLKEEQLWNLGGEISCKVNGASNSSIEHEIGKLTNLIDYTKIIEISTDFNTSDFTLSSTYSLQGISISDFFEYYTKKDIQKWLYEGSLDEFNSSSCLLSLEYKKYGYSIDHILSIFYANTTDSSLEALNVTINGFFNYWPRLVMKESYSISQNVEYCVMDINVLEQILVVSETTYDTTYLIHVREKDINSSLSYLDTLNMFSEISFVNLQIYDGINEIFLTPIAIVFEVVIILWIVLSVYERFEDINSDPKAKTLGIIGMSANYHRTLIFVKIMELILTIFVILSVVILTLITSDFILSITTSRINQLSTHTIGYILLLALLSFILLFLQLILEYLRLRRINLALIFRHPE